MLLRTWFIYNHGAFKRIVENRSSSILDHFSTSAIVPDNFSVILWIYPTAVYARSVSLQVYPTVVYARSIWQLAYPTVGYARFISLLAYPTIGYANRDISLAYPMAVYPRFISVLVCPTAVYIHYWHTQLSCTPGIEPYVPKGCVH